MVFASILVKSGGNRGDKMAGSRFLEVPCSSKDLSGLYNNLSDNQVKCELQLSLFN